MIQMQGMPAAPGCAVGQVLLFPKGPISISKQAVDEPKLEIKQLDFARNACLKFLERLLGQKQRDEDVVGILEAYLEILHDDVFFSKIKKTIRDEFVCAPWAIEQARADVAAAFAALDDDYLRERVADINYICNCIITYLLSGSKRFAFPQGKLVKDAVVFAEDLSPVDTMNFDSRQLKAIVTERGGTTSHTVILAKSLGIPAIVAIGPFPNGLENGQQVLVDADRGCVTVDPDISTLQNFEKQMKLNDSWKRMFALYETSPAITRDGLEIRVCVNAGEGNSLDEVDSRCCDGVGLFRTEFLYMDRTTYPTEEEQFEVYRRLAQRLGQKELVIRTLDIGGDKRVDYMCLPEEANPFLGLRAIRLCLARKDMFKTQLRAILRASCFGNVKIMFPMVVTLEELVEAKRLLAEAQAELEQMNIPYQRDIPVGIMIETPAAVWISDQLAEHVSFFSIGTNDLIQYMTAADRLNEHVHYLYDSYNISVLRAMKLVCDQAASAGIDVSICGEAAAIPQLIPLWCALGVNKLSLAPSLLGQTKYIISQLTVSELRNEMSNLFGSRTISEMKSNLERLFSAIEFPRILNDPTQSKEFSRDCQIR